MPPEETKQSLPTPEQKQARELSGNRLYRRQRVKEIARANHLPFQTINKAVYGKGGEVKL